MGYYKDLEYDFIERTLNLISQYESILHKYPFEQQYNYTLLINCLTGLIVMPKERTLDIIPNDRLLANVQKEMGLIESVINPDSKTLREFIISMRHAVAHFTIKIESHSKDLAIDNIVFYDPQKGSHYVVANFKATELLPFIRYYAGWLMSNLKLYRKVIAL